jgi:hypothetical protein
MVSSSFVHYDPTIRRAEKEKQRAQVLAQAARFSNAQRLHRLSQIQQPKDHQSSLNKRNSDDVQDVAEPHRRGGGRSLDTTSTWHNRGTIIVRNLRGNSDPFDVFDIAITPKVTRLMDFIRNVSIPSTYGEFDRTFKGLDVTQAAFEISQRPRRWVKHIV